MHSIRGYIYKDIYKDVWNPSIGNDFSYQGEEENLQDPYAVAVISSFLKDFLKSHVDTSNTRGTLRVRSRVWLVGMKARNWNNYRRTGGSGYRIRVKKFLAVK